MDKRWTECGLQGGEHEPRLRSALLCTSNVGSAKLAILHLDDLLAYGQNVDNKAFHALLSFHVLLSFHA